MKKVLILAILFAGAVLEAWGKGPELPKGLDGTVWRADFDRAARQAVYAEKPLCLYFYRPGVSYCDNFVAAMNADPAVRKALEGWVCIAVNEWNLNNQEITVNYHIEIVPQVVLVEPKGTELTRFADKIDLKAFGGALRRYGKPSVHVGEDSPQVEEDISLGSLRLVFHKAAPVDHAKERIAPIGGQLVLDFVVGDPESERRAGVEMTGWGEPERMGGLACRNTDQTGVGDGKGGFAYLKIPIKDPSGSYRLVLQFWGDSRDPNSDDRTWLRQVRAKTGPGDNDWDVFRFKETMPLVQGRYQERVVDFPRENLPIRDGALTIGLGQGDQQVWLSRVELYHFAGEKPSKE